MLVEISVYESPELKKVFLFIKCLFICTVYSAGEKNILDRFSPNSQKTYQLGR